MGAWSEGASITVVANTIQVSVLRRPFPGDPRAKVRAVRATVMVRIAETRQTVCHKERAGITCVRDAITVEVICEFRLTKQEWIHVICVRDAITVCVIHTEVTNTISILILLQWIGAPRTVVTHVWDTIFICV